MKCAALFLIFLFGCSTAGYHVTDAKDAWINVRSGPGFLGTDTLYYCRSYSGPEGATPTCYKPRVIEGQ